MNLPCRVSLLLVLTVFVLYSNTLQQAYNSYLQKEYTKSLELYLAVYDDDTASRDALYGVVNSYAALGEYETALSWCDTLLHKGSDLTMIEKKIWLLGLLNRGKEAGKLWKKDVVPSYNEEQRRQVSLSCGWGFYGSGNYRLAEVWFQRAQGISSGIDVEQGLLLTRQKRTETKPVWSASLYGGPIAYSHQTIVGENGRKYGYDGGSYFGGEGSITLNKKHTITVMASRFDASFSEQEYYYKGDTLLEWDTVYTGTKLYGIAIDTLYYSLDEQFVGGKYNLQKAIDSLKNSGYEVDTVIAFTTEYIEGVPFDDTAYYLFKSDSLGELDSVDVSGLDYDTFDSIAWKDTVHWDSLVEWNDTVRATPDPMWQNTFYVGYVGTKPGGKNITLGTGLQLFNSNIVGMKKGMVLWLMNRHSTKWFDCAGNWYYIATDKRSLAQSGIRFIRQFGKLLVDVEPIMTWCLSTEKGYTTPAFQKSLTAHGYYSWKRIAFDQTITVGERKFTAESAGMNLVTVREEHRLTSGSKVIVNPFKNEKISLFGLLRFEKYATFDRKIILGGVTLVW